MIFAASVLKTTESLLLERVIFPASRALKCPCPVSRRMSFFFAVILTQAREMVMVDET